MIESKLTLDYLKQLRALPLEEKVLLTRSRIIEWYNHFHGNVYVSFSGGKDSTVLLHIARSIYPDIKAMFCNTGLEYPEVQSFVKSFDNVDILYPTMKFNDIISTYGYPLINKETAEAIYYARRILQSNKPGTMTYLKRKELLGLREYTERSSQDLALSAKSRYNKEKYLTLCYDAPYNISNYCCHVMKKHPARKYERATHFAAILGTLTEESMMRQQAWLRNGCNAFNAYRKTSTPLAFWTEQDILAYIAKHNLEIASVYGKITSSDQCTYTCSGCPRTGCIFCAFGAHREKGETRFQSLAKTHPRQYEYCLKGGQWVDNPAYDPTDTGRPDETGWVNWNPKKIWVPSKTGLGMKKVFDVCNDLYGKDFIRYE